MWKKSVGFLHARNGLYKPKLWQNITNFIYFDFVKVWKRVFKAKRKQIQKEFDKKIKKDKMKTTKGTEIIILDSIH